MSRIIVAGGKQRKRTLGVKEWSQYEQGVILVLDTDSGQLIRKHEYTSPGDVTPSQPKASTLFKSASLQGDIYYACTQTEVIIYSLPDFIVQGYISLESFNDVHHVTPTARDTLLVVSTGLDLVQEIDYQGDVLREWFTIGSSDWTRFSPEIDYRKVLSTKPHHSHPNFVFEIDDQIWVTRFEQKDACCLTAEGRMDIGIERPHDGHCFGQSVYFTTVDAHVVEVDIENLLVRRAVSLQNYMDHGRLAGWCRGLCPIDNDNHIIGFSRIRASRIHSNLIWARKWLENAAHSESLPTRVMKINIATGIIDWEYDLEPLGLNAVFSIHQLV